MVEDEEDKFIIRQMVQLTLGQIVRICSTSPENYTFPKTLGPFLFTLEKCVHKPSEWSGVSIAYVCESFVTKEKKPRLCQQCERRVMMMIKLRIEINLN